MDEILFCPGGRSATSCQVMACSLCLNLFRDAAHSGSDWEIGKSRHPGHPITAPAGRGSNGLKLSCSLWCRHVDLAGNEFPFSRGVSFYEVNDEGKIVSARDCVEPAIKPGASALQVTSLLHCTLSAEPPSQQEAYSWEA